MHMYPRCTSAVMRRLTKSASTNRFLVSTPALSSRHIVWQPDGATFEVPKDAQGNGVIATPFGSTGKSAEDRVLPSVRQLNDELPSAEELKQRLERGESIDSSKPSKDGDDD
ncbi:Hypothetical protein, putative [Bodo saltans]|uniref:Uncharacterized protein n=1 Tax=Bodo saltans TaxID=75058 RepID=A0A0S4JJ98_BODSA|nr:Hypothetical protein, putative [Bodo saltans]|eukprot:CUG89481.1 Hypothetical protein, putative [Bodo saltans]